MVVGVVVPTLPAMQGFGVVVSSVERASAATQSAGVDLGAELSRLRGEADEVLSGRWRGLAADAFDRAWVSWDGGAREVVAGLDRLAELLARTGREYGVRDEVSAATLRLAVS